MFSLTKAGVGKVVAFVGMLVYGAAAVFGPGLSNLSNPEVTGFAQIVFMAIVAGNIVAILSPLRPPEDPIKLEAEKVICYWVYGISSSIVGVVYYFIDRLLLPPFVLPTTIAAAACEFVFWYTLHPVAKYHLGRYRKAKA